MLRRSLLSLRFLLALSLWLVVLTWVTLSAAAFDTTPPDPTASDLMTALAGHQWILAAGAGAYLLVALTKQGWLSAWLAQKIPAAYQPVIAFALTSVSLAGAEIWHGTPWLVALIHALEAAGVAVLTHEGLIAGARKGRELLPVAPYAKAKLEAAPRSAR